MSLQLLECLPQSVLMHTTTSGLRCPYDWLNTACALALLLLLLVCVAAVLEHGICSKAADVYSFGVLLFQVGLRVA
jgi:hypothetical protein